ncbi:MAG: bifunctional pyr operon transcriptional regulator/uracil phosphoribosyltransferase PyrR [Candidatus Omnitrophica bacterium]|nr:bifunctional pyr operon transcriptional regulator/uracil phosphoribosyltransferase PyrR [Candidatus Omnitrophota bacterium]MDD5351631.1 bifunctional pyr operon transcriptional regulator/uracil phosphoribosyltransferase PyrR [Candidatus Omnitrophota bacterium]MDD5550841.1 bifunctional pyr operon transcriptional regulator/uracil phosphoribosyltransferase PyrR [Candidatus Omnitrophota bacterium]
MARKRSKVILREKEKILDKAGIEKIIKRLAHEIIEKNKGTEQLAIIGIMTRGAHLAKRLANAIMEIDGKQPPLGTLDITFYRDDLSVIAEQPVVKKTDLMFDITDKKVILVDDVLYTGRTIRAALTQLLDFGRPQFIQLAVLIDRGFRELPIRADFVGKNIPTSQKEIVEVRLEETDGTDEVVIMEKENNQ